MSSKNDFLFELGTEELPPKALKTLAKSLLSSVEKQLTESQIIFGKTKWYASPRRLSFSICDLDDSQQDLLIEKQGPLLSIAYKDDEPTKIGLGFAKSFGVDISTLGEIDTPKGPKLFYKTIQSGVQTVDLIEEIITKALKQLPIPKMMKWGDSDIVFVRPVHWVLAIYANKPISINILGKHSSDITYGHRFHHPEAIQITSIGEYVRKLSESMVIVDWDQRREKIVEQVKTIAKNNNYVAVLKDELVDEVCAIVEYPNAMMCSFNKNFLRVPQEALISSMEEHQKCFALLEKNQLVENFITISNIISRKPEVVISGNQKVMNARLADAAFFFDTDLKNTLDSLLPKLESVTFHNKLGNMYQKAQRIAQTSQNIANLSNTDSDSAYRAGLLAKADLISDMVFEFTDLQGIIGKYYARAHGETELVSNAIEQQYWPKYSGAELPDTKVANCVALAEKLDTLVGIFGAGQKPTGNKDPFALRRSAIGVLRILRDTGLDLVLDDVVDLAVSSYSNVNNISLAENTKDDVVSFCLERLKNMYKEEGVSADIFESVNSVDFGSIEDFNKRVLAIVLFRKLSQSQTLIASNKRVANILAKNSSSMTTQYDSNLNEKNKCSYEVTLFDRLISVQSEVLNFVSECKYFEALDTLTSLDVEISQFFENVMIIDENIEIRDNNIALLQNVYDIFTSVADISKLN
jgi:glycyl-tRNA synthetase beta chain